MTDQRTTPLLLDFRIPLRRRILGGLGFALLWLVIAGMGLLLLWTLVLFVGSAWHSSVNSDAESTVRQLVRPECLRSAARTRH